MGAQRRGDALAPQARELLLAVRTYADPVRAILPSPAGAAAERPGREGTADSKALGAPRAPRASTG